MNKRFFNQQNLTRRLRLLSVLFAMLLMPIGAWAVNYDIIVGGVQVTSDNAANITGGQISDGKVSFDAENNILTLNGAIIDMSNTGQYPIQSSLANLTIKLEGDNNIFTVNADKPNAVKGPGTGTLTFTTNVNPKRCPLTVEGISATASLASGYTVSNTFETRDYNIIGPGEEAEDGWKVKIFDKDPTYGNQVIIWNFKKYSLSIGGSRVNSDNLAGGHSGITAYDPETHTLPVNNMDYAVKSGLEELIIEVSGEVTINAAYYSEPAISFDGTMGGLSSGTLKFVKAADADLASITLTSSDPHKAIEGFSADDIIITSPLQLTSHASVAEALTATTVTIANYNTAYDIRVAGTTVTDKNKDDVLGDGKVIYDAENHKLTLNNATIIPTTEDCGIAYTGTADLTISLKGTNNVVKGNGGCSAIGYYGNEAPNLTFTKGDTQACSVQLEAQVETVIDVFTNINYDGLYRLNNSSGEGTTLIYTTTFTSALPYDLWIGTTQVTSDNAGNVLGDGKVSFTKNVGVDTGSTYTLTLNGVELTVPIKVGLANLTIDIQGTNSITTEERCIQKMENTTPAVTFTSTGTEVGNLTLKGAAGVTSVGEYNVGSFSISDKFAVLMTVYGYDDYTSNLYYFTDGSTTVAKIVPSYGVSIIKDGSGKMDICEVNADDVFKDGTVSFNNGTKILTLNGASRGAISTSLTTLTVELVGNNTLTESDAPVLCSSNGAAVTFNIQSTADVKGTLTMNRGTTAGNFNDGNVTVNITEPLAVISGSMINAKTVVIGVTCQLDVSFSTSNEWATYYGSENLATPTGLKAYQVTAVEGATVTISEIDYIPANTAVLLQNVSNNNTWSNIPASAYTGATSTFENNKLIGTASAVDVSTISGGTVYVLYNNMFKRATGGTIPANRGYLVVEPSAVNAGNAPQLSITIGDENTTAISNTDFTDNTDKANEWFSIDGVKLNGQPQKPGLYIKNGKKVFINKK